MKKFTWFLLFWFLISSVSWAGPNTNAWFGSIKLGNQTITSWDNVTYGTITRDKINWGIGSTQLPHYFDDNAFSDNLTLYGNDLITRGPWVDVRAYGAIANDNVDDDAALVAATALALATGKPLIFPAGQFDFSNQWVISSDRTARFKPLTIIGAGADAQSTTLDYVPSGGTVLNFKYASGPKIVSKGIGSVKIRGVSIYNSGTDNNFFIYTECTKLDIDSSVSFWGNTSTRNGGIQFGGDNTTTGFQGYGTVINGPYFQKIHNAGYFGTWANAIVFTNANIWNGSGGEAAFKFVPGAGQSNAGNIITGNLIEMTNYSYGMTGNGTITGNYFAGNGFYDPGDVNKIDYNFPTATFNTFIEGFSPAGEAVFIDNVAFKNNLVLRNNQSQASSLGATYLNAYNGNAIRYLSPDGVGPSIHYGDNTSTWSKDERIYTSGGVRVWEPHFVSDNGAVWYAPFIVTTYPNASWVNSTTDVVSDYTFRFRAAATMEHWADTINFKKSDGTSKGYFDANGLSIAVGNLNTVSGGSTAISSGVGTVKMSTVNPGTNTVWIPMRYNGSTYYVPGWTTNAP